LGLPFYICGIKQQIIILNQKKIKMKKFLSIAFIAASLVACKGGSSEASTTDSAAVAPVAVDSAAVTVDSAAVTVDSSAVKVDSTKK
jgi:hypothetical protein